MSLSMPTRFKLSRDAQTHVSAAGTLQALDLLDRALEGAKSMKVIVRGIRHRVAITATEELNQIIDQMIRKDSEAIESIQNLRRQKNQRLPQPAGTFVAKELRTALIRSGYNVKDVSLRSFYNFVDLTRSPEFQRKMAWIAQAARETSGPLDQEPPKEKTMKTDKTIEGLFAIHEQALARGTARGQELAVATLVSLRTLVSRSVPANSIGPSHAGRFRSAGTLEDLGLQLLAEEQKAAKAVKPPAATDAEVASAMADLFAAGKAPTAVSPTTLILVCGKAAKTLCPPNSFLHVLVRHQLVVAVRRAVEIGEYIRLNRATIKALEAIPASDLKRQAQAIKESLPKVAGELLPCDKAEGYSLPSPEQMRVYPLINAATMALTVLDEEPPADIENRKEILDAVNKLFADLRSTEHFEPLEMVRVCVVDRALGTNSAARFWKSLGSRSAELIESWFQNEHSQRVRETIWNSFAASMPVEAATLASKI